LVIVATAVAVAAPIFRFLLVVVDAHSLSPYAVLFRPSSSNSVFVVNLGFFIDYFFLSFIFVVSHDGCATCQLGHCNTRRDVL
jgi:hypothetical protein